MQLAYVSSRYRDHGRSSRRRRIFLPQFQAPVDQKLPAASRWQDGATPAPKGRHARCPAPALVDAGRLRAFPPVLTLHPLLCDSSRPRDSHVPPPRPPCSSATLLFSLSLSLSLSLCRWLESARTRSRTPFAARATRARRNKERTRNERTRGTRGTQRKVTRFTDNARKPREHATREIEIERKRGREDDYTRGECLTIDFHASLIYSTAPPAAAFFVPAGPNHGEASQPVGLHHHPRPPAPLRLLAKIYGLPRRFFLDRRDPFSGSRSAPASTGSVAISDATIPSLADFLYREV